MKTDLRRFAPLGLVLSVLAVLSFIILLIVKGLVAGGLATLPDPKVLDNGLLICVGVLILGLAVTAFLDPDKARSFLVGRQVQYGSNAVIMLVAFVGILFFINMLVYQSTSTAPPWDWTEDKENTLAPETINIIKALPAPVVVHAYYKNPDENAKALLDKFKQNSNGKLTYEFIDPDFNPGSAQRDGVTSNATIVMIMGERKEPVSFASEQELDTALIKLTNPTQHTIYFLTGHGERDTENAGETSFSQMKTMLVNKNYTVKVLNLNSQHTVPNDAKAVIIAGPQVPLSADEITALEAYTNIGGGALVIMEEPKQLTKLGNAPDLLANMIAKWGITLDDDIVLDANQGNAYLVAADSQNYGQHPITQKLIGYNIGYYTTRSMKLAATAPEGITLTTLTQSLPVNVWGEMDYKSIQDRSASVDPLSDIQGPVILSVAAENAATRGRLVVFGDSDFATDIFTQQFPTFSNILLNAIDWSTQQENLINLTPKNNVERTFEPPNIYASIGIILLSICFIPLLVVLAGVWSWYSRRRRG